MLTDGNARFKNNNNKMNFSGELINKSGNKLITHFEVLIVYEDYKDKIGGPISEIVKINDTWIPPRHTKSFFASSLKHYPKEKIAKKAKFNWKVVNVRGVDFVLK